MPRVSYLIEMNQRDADVLAATRDPKLVDCGDACVLLPGQFGVAARALKLTTGQVPNQTEEALVAAAKLLKGALPSAYLIKCTFRSQRVIA